MAARKKTGGRKKGTPNKGRINVCDTLEEMGCNPIRGMAEIAARAMEKGDEQLAGQMYKELAQYVAPKRKSVEVSGDQENPLAVSTVELIAPTVVDGSG
jgi:hypothetical protein